MEIVEISNFFVVVDWTARTCATMRIDITFQNGMLQISWLWSSDLNGRKVINGWHRLTMHKSIKLNESFDDNFQASKKEIFFLSKF